jgi:hypothetical protein
VANIPKYADEAAFPRPRIESLPNDAAALTLLPEQWGLTKRELFAAMAMQGWLAGCSNAYYEFTGPASNPGVLARSCVKFADALLAELAKQ